MVVLLLLSFHVLLVTGSRTCDADQLQWFGPHKQVVGVPALCSRVRIDGSSTTPLTETQFKALWPALIHKDVQHLSSFELRNQILNEESLSALGAFIATDPPLLRNLTLTGVGLTSQGKGVPVLSRALLQNSHLRFLNIAHNMLGVSEGISNFAELGSSGGSGSRISQGAAVREESLAALNALGQSLVRLEEIHLEANGLGPDAANALFSGMTIAAAADAADASDPSSSAIRRLYLSHNPLGPRGSASLSALLAPPALPPHLALSRSSFSNLPPLALVDTLAVGRTGLGDAGTLAITQALSQRAKYIPAASSLSGSSLNPSVVVMQRLSLFGNRIGNVGAEAIAECLAAGTLGALGKKRGTIKVPRPSSHDDDDDGNLNDECALGSEERMQRGKSSDLNLAQNSIGDAGALALAKALLPGRMPARADQSMKDCYVRAHQHTQSHVDRIGVECPTHESCNDHAGAFFGVLGLEENGISSKASKLLLLAARDAGGVKVLLAGNAGADATLDAAREDDDGMVAENYLDLLSSNELFATKDVGQNLDDRGDSSFQGKERAGSNRAVLWGEEHLRAQARRTAAFTKNRQALEGVASGEWSERLVWIGAAEAKATAERWTAAFGSSGFTWNVMPRRVVTVFMLVKQEFKQSVFLKAFTIITAASLIAGWGAGAWAGSTSDDGKLSKAKKRDGKL